MIIGLNKNNDEENLKVTEVAKGLFVVRNAYGGDYDFFDSGEELFSNSEKESDPKIKESEESENTEASKG